MLNFTTGFFRLSTFSLIPCVQMSILKPLVPGYRAQPQGQSHFQLLFYFIIFLKQDSCPQFTCGCLSVYFIRIYKHISGFISSYHFSCFIGRNIRVYKPSNCRKYKFILTTFPIYKVLSV